MDRVEEIGMNLGSLISQAGGGARVRHHPCADVRARAAQVAISVNGTGSFHLLLAAGDDAPEGTELIFGMAMTMIAVRCLGGGPCARAPSRGPLAAPDSEHRAGVR
eukprot:3618314-Alexandrium_andersonii.AAC.1